MIRHQRFALALFLLVATVAASAWGDEPVLVRQGLARHATRMVGTLPPVPETHEAWQAYRATLRRQLAERLALPEREPMRAAVTDRSERGGLVFEKVVYHWAGSTYASATLIHDGTDRTGHRALVMPSGWLGHPTFAANRPVVEQAVRQGFLVLFVDDPRTGRRRAPAADLHTTASAVGMPVIGIQVFDALRGLDYLQTRADIDPNQIGVGGCGVGATQAYLAAALEPQFKFVVAVSGTTTHEAMIQASAEGNGPEDPSAFFPGLLTFAEMDRVAACVAPRPVVISGTAGDGAIAEVGYANVLRTMRQVYSLHDVEDRIHEVPAGSDLSDSLAIIVQGMGVLSLPSPPVARVGEAEEPSFDLLAYFEQQLASRDVVTDSTTTSAEDIVATLRDACGLDRLEPVADQVADIDAEPTADDPVWTERVMLGVDADFPCPAVLIGAIDEVSATKPGIVISHDDRQCAASEKIVAAARHLALAGYWVIVPDHASVAPASRQPLADELHQGFYGDEAATFQGPAEALGLSPLALRVAENLAAVRHLGSRQQVDPSRITIVGVGYGAVDACMAALLDPRVAGVTSLDAYTLRDRMQQDVVGRQRFFRMTPSLPGLLRVTDLDGIHGALAPRPLALVQLKKGTSATGFDQVAATAKSYYAISGNDASLSVFGPRDITEQLENETPQGIERQLIAAARPLLPIPPTPGLVGNAAVLVSRQTTDSAAGLVWIVAEMGGYDQEFYGENYRLQTWSFFNNNGDAQKGFSITPLVFRLEGEQYRLAGIGTTRVNDGTGRQTFPFEPVAGTDTVGDGYFFGWHTGDGQQARNAGVVEFADAGDARMIILTASGDMTDQHLTLDGLYRFQSQYPRQYSIMAESKAP